MSNVGRTYTQWSVHDFHSMLHFKGNVIHYTLYITSALFSVCNLFLHCTLLTLGSCLKGTRSRLFARGCWPGSVVFVEIDSSMNTGDICSAQFNHMPVLLPLFPNKLHRFSTTSLSLACLFQAVLMWSVLIFEAERGWQRLTGKITLNLN